MNETSFKPAGMVFGADRRHTAADDGILTERIAKRIMEIANGALSGDMTSPDVKSAIAFSKPRLWRTAENNHPAGAVADINIVDTSDPANPRGLAIVIDRIIGQVYIVRGFPSTTYDEPVNPLGLSKLATQTLDKSEAFATFFALMVREIKAGNAPNYRFVPLVIPARKDAPLVRNPARNVEPTGLA